MKVAFKKVGRRAGRLVVALSIALSTALPTAVKSQDYSTNAFDIGPLTEGGGCWLGGEWSLPGRSAVHLELNLLTDGALYAGVWSDGWSRPSADVRKLLGVVFWGAGDARHPFALLAMPTGAGTAYSEKPGLFSMVPDDQREEFLSTFASARSVSVFSRDISAAEGTEFDTILEGGLGGSSAAAARLRTCAADVGRREAAEAAREASVSHIARDPFRPAAPASGVTADPAETPEWSSRPTPIFPDRALSSGVQSGRAALECLVTSAGSLLSCHAVSEDPAGLGFAAAALAAARNARVSPSSVEALSPRRTLRFTVEFEAGDDTPDK